jgi:hypothetical protein
MIEAWLLLGGVILFSIFILGFLVWLETESAIIVIGFISALISGSLTNKIIESYEYGVLAGKSNEIGVLVGVAILIISFLGYQKVENGSLEDERSFVSIIFPILLGASIYILLSGAFILGIASMISASLMFYIIDLKSE